MSISTAMDAGERPKEIAEVRAMALVRHRKSQIEALGGGDGLCLDGGAQCYPPCDEKDGSHAGALQRGSVDNAELHGFEDLDYLALDLVSYLPAEKLKKLLENLQKQENFVQDILRRNKTLAQEVERLTEENKQLQLESSQLQSVDRQYEHRPSLDAQVYNESFPSARLRRSASAHSSMLSERVKEEHKQPKPLFSAEARLAKRLEWALHHKDEALHQKEEEASDCECSRMLQKQSVDPAAFDALQKHVEHLAREKADLEATLERYDAELRDRVKTLDETLSEMNRLHQPRSISIRLAPARYARRSVRRRECDAAQHANEQPTVAVS